VGRVIFQPLLQPLQFGDVHGENVKALRFARHQRGVDHQQPLPGLQLILKTHHFAREGPFDHRFCYPIDAFPHEIAHRHPPEAGLLQTEPGFVGAVGEQVAFIAVDLAD